MQTSLTIQSDDTDANYDDGLVHGHGWASSSSEQTIAQVEQQPQAAWRDDSAGCQDEDEAYDDGLVHGHGWASSR